MSSKQSPFWQACFSQNTTYWGEYRRNYIKNKQNRMLEDLFGLKNLQIPPNPEVTEVTTRTSLLRSLLVYEHYQFYWQHLPPVGIFLIPPSMHKHRCVFSHRTTDEMYTMKNLENLHVIFLQPRMVFLKRILCQTLWARGNHQKWSFVFSPHLPDQPLSKTSKPETFLSSPISVLLYN